MAGEEYLFLKIERAEDKYKKQIRTGVFFTLIGVVLVVGSVTFYYLQGVYDSDENSLQQILPIVLCFVPAFGIKLCKDGYKEWRLYYKAAMNGLLIDEDGVSGPLVLLEGPTRNALREASQMVFKVPWDAVECFILEPVRGSKRNPSPPYYKIAVKGGGQSMQSSFFILRSYFEGREQQVIDHVRRYLDDEQIIFNDELTEERV